MRLVVKKEGQKCNEYKFSSGPINFGRHSDSQVFLSDLSVSRHHAILFNTEDGKWILEDLNSANKTYLDGQEIKKSEVKDGSIIRIGDFSIEISIREKTESEKEMNLEDTLEKTAFHLDSFETTERAPQVITRRLDFEHAPDMRIPSKRARDFMHAAEEICKSHNEDEMISSLLGIANRQFTAFHSWCALRNSPSGSMTAHSGRRRDGVRVLFNDIKLNQRITEAIEKKQFLLIPRVPFEMREQQKVNSAMIGPIVSKDGCFGILYIDNDMSHDGYGLSDLDYLMMLCIHTAAILRNF